MAVMLSVDRQRGALIGLAVSDALGAAVEFRPPGTFPEVTGYRGGGPHGLPLGAWTDDTGMALAPADSSWPRQSTCELPSSVKSWIMPASHPIFPDDAIPVPLNS